MRGAGNDLEAAECKSEVANSLGVPSPSADRFRTSRQSIDTTTRSPAATGRSITGVVGFGYDTRSDRRPSRTRETDKCAPVLA